MNIITHDKAYSFYPKATFEERLSLMISTEGSKQDTARAKYVSRGWGMITSPSLSELSNPKSPFSPAKRYVGDSQCWTIPLKHEHASYLPEGFIESNTWALKYNADYIPAMLFQVLLTDCLDFSYLVVDDSLADYLWPFICPTEVRKEYVFSSFLLSFASLKTSLGIWIEISFNSFVGEEHWCQIRWYILKVCIY